MLYCSQKYNIQPTTMHRNQQSIVNNKAPTKSTTPAKKSSQDVFFAEYCGEGKCRYSTDTDKNNWSIRHAKHP